MQVEGLALSSHTVDISHRAPGWYFALAQLQKTRLLSLCFLAWAEGRREQGGTQVADVSEYECL